MRTFHARMSSVRSSIFQKHLKMNLKYRILMRRLALGIAASTAITATTHARQPWIDTGAMDDRMHQDGHGRASATGRDDAGMADPVANDPVLLGKLQRRMERHRRELLPEYQRRLASDGSASADLWLQREASTRGRREAEALQREAASSQG